MKRKIRNVAAIVFVLVGVLFFSSCFQKSNSQEKTGKEETKNIENETNNIDINAGEIMDLYIDGDNEKFLALTKRLALESCGKDIMRQPDTKMDFFARGIDYEATTDKFRCTETDGVAIAVSDNEVDGVSWELIIADEAEYNAIMKRMEGYKDYKLDTKSMEYYENVPDFHVDKIFMKAVYDEEMSKSAGMRLGIGYYIFFEGRKNGYYVNSFSHGNGDVEM